MPGKSLRGGVCATQALLRGAALPHSIGICVDLSERGRGRVAAGNRSCESTGSFRPSTTALWPRPGQRQGPDPFHRRTFPESVLHRGPVQEDIKHPGRINLQDLGCAQQTPFQTMSLPGEAATGR